ncbi:phosphoribosyltransferase [Rhodospirillum rubrum F11]|uniref:Phosphoribosyltransferase n=3 Tax=Rhodospirillum rubrum TaxID=1085 RepID=Q2RWF4_RHORT|nr:ComF family protein [Rhodospirillum rubrum]ABC21541.1 Phosphoribosyltransferase [Rhodospirillum rubrum ATCC 11170]AEO47226.1 phosphoribosyltransferase [Rhodospirillum rubrum F11]MBK5953163.1 amidophosphoribosyltransferase [Rhodospirillum rubrum]QXG81213.1 ComF family protein [Rhodospirillum rubrum]
MGASWREMGRGLFDLLLPPRCLGCGTQVADPDALCPACFSGLAHITEPFCACCGLPFELGGEGEGERLCGACLGTPPLFSRARAVWRYDDASARLILGFKHADRLDSVPGFARWMARAGRALLAGDPVLVPVPLHRWRLFSRRYNQAAVLAQAIADAGDLDYRPLALVRRRATPSQGGLGRGARARNVQGAFVVVRPDEIAGRRVVLIDDVLTTGATANACARALLAAGATGVDVLTLARVSLEET